MKHASLAKWLPLIIGIFLGTISVVMGIIPQTVAQWTGMTVIGNHVGYLLGALITAYFNSQSWLKSFISSSLTIIIATAVYYFLILIVHLFDNTATYGFESGLIYWPIVGIICGALSATAIWLLKHLKSRFLCLGVFITGYLGMIIVIYLWIARFYINLYSTDPTLISRHGRSISGAVFEIAFAFVTTTAVWIFAYKRQFPAKCLES